jgi:hypothetical protein
MVAIPLLGYMAYGRLHAASSTQPLLASWCQQVHHRSRAAGQAGARSTKHEAPNLTTMKFTLLTTTLLATPLLVAAQGTGTECATLADFTIFKRLLEEGDKQLFQQLTTSCMACVVAGSSGVPFSVGTCFPTAAKGKCTPGDVALGRAKALAITATDSDPPKGLTVACIGCVMNGIIIPQEKCEGLGGTAASAQCGNGTYPDDATCIQCKQAAHLAGYIACEGVPALAPPPASSSGAHTALPAALASIATIAAVVCSI